MHSPCKHLLLGLGVGIVACALDQLSKWLIIAHIIIPPHNVVELLPVFNLVLVWNHGISFGMFAGQRQPLMLVALSAVIVSVLIVWLYKSTSKLNSFALGLIIGGAIGNVVDRLRFGAVVDFLDTHWGEHHWPAFNVADSCIFIGVVVLCGLSMFTADTPPTSKP